MERVNPYEIEARQRKALALACLLNDHGIAADDVHLISAAQWRQLAIAAKVNRPGPETIEMVEGMMRQLRKEVAA